MYAISLEIEMQIGQIKCLNLCFQGQGIRLRHLYVIDMVQYPKICKLAAAIIEKSCFADISINRQANETNKVSLPMFSRSRNMIKKLFMYLMMHNT